MNDDKNQGDLSTTSLYFSTRLVVVVDVDVVLFDVHESKQEQSSQQQKVKSKKKKDARE